MILHDLFKECLCICDLHILLFTVLYDTTELSNVWTKTMKFQSESDS
ncbi:hypothetical protein TcasGA2_TC032741 [Tribolium castaneum]|uniref:Uncharacterized protein n=1 Tax=Tribolium castaneum TaxID=7070 RepID=A0A139WIW8_TRICA|nr:hypothetical protein TcasGA2_TC032741 [Tribolium castaneum]